MPQKVFLTYTGVISTGQCPGTADNMLSAICEAEHSQTPLATSDDHTLLIETPALGQGLAGVGHSRA